VAVAGAINWRPIAAAAMTKKKASTRKPTAARRRPIARSLEPVSEGARHRRAGRGRIERGRSASAAGAADLALTVVGVGASAGGLEAFSELLRAVDQAKDLAIVFVQHLSPDHESALVSLLSRQTSLDVVQASEGVHLRGGCVYVIPPNAQMELRGEELHLSPRPVDRSRYMPIDTFFSSLAEAAGARSIAVVLSGTATDGSNALRDVKLAGGVTFAQAPDSAKYDGMPRAAIDTGNVDLVLLPHEIGAKLSEIARRGRMGQTPFADDHEIAPDQLQRVYEVLRPVSGVDFRHYKLPTVKRRLFRRMALHRLTEVGPYLELVERDPNEARSLYQDLLIHVTRFFRDPESFFGLSSHVLPAVVEDRPADHPIRVWVSGCATGEEAYSVAIALLESLQADHADIKVQIFATDVSESAIEFARAGVYPDSIEADVSPERLRRFFTRVASGYRVTKAVRDLCVFARQDLTKDPPFSHLDLVLCRNVLIYMDAVLQKTLLSVFHYALNPGGFLMLGQAESIGAQAGLFTLVDKRLRIHRRKDGPTLPTMVFPSVRAIGSASRGQPALAEGHGAEKGLLLEVSRALVERYAPPGVVVDSDLQIVQVRGQTGLFLEPAPGDASLNVLKMAREGLLFGLRTALQTARKNRSPVRRSGLQVKWGRRWLPVTLDVLPLTSGSRLHYLVLFNTPQAEGEREAPPSAAKRREGRSAVDVLTRELAASRDYLQSIIQELEAANEELQSANEEILSSNEELQSTNEELDTAKEELQSMNEELNTVNEELHGTNDELSRVNSDLINLLSSVQIAIVIVSADLRIRRFTPMAEKVLNLIPTDVNRAIGHINPNIDCPNLDQLIAECIDHVSVLEREVRDRQGRWYSLRIRPYKDVDNRIDGAVLALFDTDGPKRTEDRARAAVELARCLMDAAEHPVALLDEDLRIVHANAPFGRLTIRGGSDLRNQCLEEVLVSSVDVAPLRDLLASDTTAMARQTLPAIPQSGGPWTLEARAIASHDDPGGRQLLLFARQAG
jgi:two-component system, chemotaxis family, CheB/CheR fusion protein